MIQQARAEATALKSNVAALEAAKATLEGTCKELGTRAERAEGDRARLAEECARGRRKMRIKRYGLPMLVARRIAAKLPFSGLRKWIDERMYRVDRRYIK